MAMKYWHLGAARRQRELEVGAPRTAGTADGGALPPGT